MTETLKSCPFCGNTSEERTPEGKIRMQPVKITQANPSTYGLPNNPDEKYFHVVCGKCHACGGMGMAGYIALTNTTITEEQAKEIAIQKWNQRKDV